MYPKGYLVRDTWLSLANFRNVRTEKRHSNCQTCTFISKQLYRFRFDTFDNVDSK